jgi:hypothetical protein
MSKLISTTLQDLGSGNNTAVLNAIKGSAKAWVNFNGTGAVAIRASYNVTSITDNATGDYTVNFTNALPDANYAPAFSTGGTGSSGYVRTPVASGYLTTSLRLENLSTGAVNQDSAIITAAIFANN